jgi:hypothetical protein
MKVRVACVVIVFSSKRVDRADCPEQRIISSACWFRWKGWFLCVYLRSSHRHRGVPPGLLWSYSGYLQALFATLSSSVMPLSYGFWWMFGKFHRDRCLPESSMRRVTPGSRIDEVSFTFVYHSFQKCITIGLL